MNKTIRIGTRESRLAVWQAESVKKLLADRGYQSELVYIKSEGDTDLKTPLYELGVQGIFTKALDIALLNEDIDIAVHSMKDVPTLMAMGVIKAAVLPRASHKDLLVLKQGRSFSGNEASLTIATSSTRRKAQWLNRYPETRIENLRGNVNTRLQKVAESDWTGAIFAAAGLERIGVKPENAVELDWMLPAPAQGAIIVVCRQDDEYCINACAGFNDIPTDLCTGVERDFLRALSGGCSTPISALAMIKEGNIIFEGSLLSTDGKQKKTVSITKPAHEADNIGQEAAVGILANGGRQILDSIQNGK